MISKLHLGEAIRIGPWRIARKHLLFILIFCLLILIFGIVVLETHAFDSNSEEDEDDDDGDGDENESEYEFGNGIHGADWVVVAIMVSAGMIALLAGLACFLAKSGTAEHLRSPGRQNPSSVYTVQYNGEVKTNNVPRATYSSPQPAPIWTGQVTQTQPDNNTTRPMQLQQLGVHQQPVQNHIRQQQQQHSRQSQPVPLQQQVTANTQFVIQQPVATTSSASQSQNRSQARGNGQRRIQRPFANNKRPRSDNSSEMPPPYSP